MVYWCYVFSQDIASHLRGLGDFFLIGKRNNILERKRSHMGSRRADIGSIQRETEGLYKKRLKGVLEVLNTQGRWNL